MRFCSLAVLLCMSGAAIGQDPSTSGATGSEPDPAAPPATGSPNSVLNLVCGGGGTANKQAVTNATAWDSDGESTSITARSDRSERFTDQVDVRLFSGDDRIRLPRTMLPPIRGGNGGWFKLKGVKVTDRAITASAAVNIVNNPKVHIDRLTGTISINGRAGSYTGECEAVDPDAPRKF